MPVWWLAKHQRGIQTSCWLPAVVRQTDLTTTRAAPDSRRSWRMAWPPWAPQGRVGGSMSPGARRVRGVLGNRGTRSETDVLENEEKRKALVSHRFLQPRFKTRDQHSSICLYVSISPYRTHTPCGWLQQWMRQNTSSCLVLICAWFSDTAPSMSPLYFAAMSR